MRKNDRMTVEILEETNLGFGVAKVDGMVVFVADVMTNEQVEIQITKVKKSYAYARVISIIKASNQRVEPQCEKARICGGCQLQHRTYASQCEFKQDQMNVLFSNWKVKSIVRAENPWYYRNKAQFPIQIKENQVVMGFYRRHSNDIVQQPTCCIQSKEINEIYSFFQNHLTVQHAQGLRHLFVRSSKQGQVQIVLIGTQKNDWDDLILKATKQYPNIVSVFYNHNKGTNNVILGDTYQCLYGKDTLKMQYLDLEVDVSFPSFFQVNTQQMEKLYTCVASAIRFNKEMKVVEFYSGLGTIGMSLAHKVKEVIGVEIEPEAVEDALLNCKQNHIENCHYECMDATDFASKLAKQKEKVDVVIVDPPRKGCTPQGIYDMCVLNPEHIIYVSCNPVTLKRDIILFEEKGYQCQWVQPVDLFPQTVHVESVVLMSRDGSRQ